MMQQIPRKRCRHVIFAMVTLVPSVACLSPRQSVPSSVQRGTVATKTSSMVATTQPPPAPLHPSLYQNEELEEYDSSILESIPSYLELQRSTGSEVLQSELQRQIDQAADAPNRFLDSHVEDATELEKMAMGSITEQLPQRAVRALSKEQLSDNLNHATTRVTVEQEIELAKVIQNGAKLQAVRDELAKQTGRDVSSQEWAAAVDLSNKELRRAISRYRQAKHELVTANLGLVHAVVNQKWINQSRTGITKAELVQEGSLGLLRAAELFDPERGLRFSTYAVVWIKGALSNNHLPELVRLPVREKTKWNKIVKAQRTLEGMNGQSPNVKEIAVASGLSANEISKTQRQMQQVKAVLSLDMQVKSQSRSGESSTVEAFSRDRSMQDEASLADRTELKLDVISALAKNLDAREARLVRLRYGLSDGLARSLAECADAMGLSESRVRQIANKALQKLRTAAEAESLEEYLLTIS